MTEEHLGSYSSPFALGHKALESLWDGTVWATEKIDGSQFSMKRCGDRLLMRSRKADLSHCQLDPSAAGMFQQAVRTAIDRFFLMEDGWTHRCEYLQRPRHNTLAYGRVPVGHLIVFDIDIGNQDYLLYDSMAHQARAIGLEPVPLLAKYNGGAIPSLDDLKALLENESVLGGCKVEGIVLKNYLQFGVDKKVLMAKLVAESFKEKHEKSWKERNPGQGDVIEALIEMYCTEARWRKAVQHRREAGELLEAPQDIGPLIHAVPADILQEDGEAIKERLFKAFWPTISRGVTRGLAEWYKAQLAENALGTEKGDQ